MGKTEVGWVELRRRFTTKVVLSEAEVRRIRDHVTRLQAEADQLRAENAAIRSQARELTWCAHCGALCPRVGRWRRYCSDECRRVAYNELRRDRYNQARAQGIPGRQAALQRWHQEGS